MTVKPQSLRRRRQSPNRCPMWRLIRELCRRFQLMTRVTGMSVPGATHPMPTFSRVIVVASSITPPHKCSTRSTRRRNCGRRLSGTWRRRSWEEAPLLHLRMERKSRSRAATRSYRPHKSKILFNISTQAPSTAKMIAMMHQKIAARL